MIFFSRPIYVYFEYEIHLVECSNGRYYKNDECLKCDYGEYQDETGQTSCKKCPSGSTTPGRESRSVEECSVLLQHSNNGRENDF